MDEKEILDKVWEYLNCKQKKPKIIIHRQHHTARYCPSTHIIELRDDSWNKMSNAEKKMVIIHEAVHACKIPHQPGYRSSFDTLSGKVYKEMWGEDEDYKEYIQKIDDKLKKIRKGGEELKACVIDNIEE